LAEELTAEYKGIRRRVEPAPRGIRAAVSAVRASTHSVTGRTGQVRPAVMRVGRGPAARED